MHFLLTGLLLFFSLSSVHSYTLQDDVAIPTPSAESPLYEIHSLTYSDAIVLGLVEGITEYLPVSSTGHLIITNHFLGLNSETPIQNASGEIIFITDKGENVPRPYTLKEAAYAYTIVIQGGAILAVILLYWQRILSIIFGCMGRDPNGLRLAINLFSAFIPAAIIGLLLDDWIESKLGSNIMAVVGALVVGAFAMLFVERWRKKKSGHLMEANEGPELHEISIPNAILIGFCQCFAMWPGTSRSMATIVGGYLVGLSPARAAEFSFLLGLITLSAASGYKFVSDGANMLEALSIGPVLMGCFVAFVSAMLAVKWLVAYLSHHGLSLFAWYRIGLALLVLFILR